MPDTLVIVETDMHMHAANQQPLRDSLQILGQDVVAVAVGLPLRVPIGEGMGGGGDRPKSMALGRFGDAEAELTQLVPRGVDGIANRRADFDLGPQKFGHDGADLFGNDRLAVAQKARRRIVDEVACVGIDEHVFLLDPNG